MLFSQAQKKLASEVTKTAADTETSDKIKNALNFGKSEVMKYSLWRHLEVPNNELVTVPQYTTGTATVVTDSRTVTISGGTVSAGFQGRFFITEKSTVQYEIISVSTSLNQLTLKTPIIEDSGTYTFTVWKKYYRVPSDVRIILPDDGTDGMPTPLEVHGYDDYSSDLTIAVTVTDGSNVLTGSGFIDNVFPGDMIIIQDKVYRVRQVQSDSQIKMVNISDSNYSGNATFKSETPYKALIKGYSSVAGGFVLSDPTLTTIIPYSYIRTLFDMVNDNDDTELPHYFDRVILDFAKAEFGRMTNSPGWQTDLTVAQLRLEKLELNKELVWQSRQTFSHYIPYGMGRGRYYGSR